MLLLYGMDKVPKNWKVTEEKAPAYSRLYFIQEGDAFYESETERRALKWNMLYCFPNKIPYKITHNPENCLKCLYLHVDIAPYVISALQEVDVSSNPVLNKLLEAFIELCRQDKERVNGPFQQQLAAAIVEFLKRLKLLERIDPAIEKSILYMTGRLNETVTIEEVSAFSGYHPQYFIRLFKECMGVTPHQFLIRYRMKTAMSLLLAGVPVAKTAEAVGYKESKNFGRTFKQTYGIIPSNVKKIFVC